MNTEKEINERPRRAREEPLIERKGEREGRDPASFYPSVESLCVPSSTETMKGSGTLVASVLAASTVALGSSSTAGDRDVHLYPSSNESCGSSSARKGQAKTSSDKEKFTPRFDGLRFIETLVTAHR